MCATVVEILERDCQGPHGKLADIAGFCFAAARVDFKEAAAAVDQLESALRLSSSIGTMRMQHSVERGDLLSTVLRTLRRLLSRASTSALATSSGTALPICLTLSPWLPAKR